MGTKRKVDQSWFNAKSVEYETPDSIYGPLDREFGFTLDVASTHENAKCASHYTSADDGLKQEWSGVCWMNPPYGRVMQKWVRKAHQEYLRGCTVVALPRRAFADLRGPSGRRPVRPAASASLGRSRPGRRGVHPRSAGGSAARCGSQTATHMGIHSPRSKPLKATSPRMNRTAAMSWTHSCHHPVFVRAGRLLTCRSAKMCNSLSPSEVSTIQLFADASAERAELASKLEAAGYRVQFVPADGPPALWFGHYEVVGQRAVAAFVEYLLSQAPTPEGS